MAETLIFDNAARLIAPGMLWVELPYVLGKRLVRREITLKGRDQDLTRVRRLGINTDLEASLPGQALDRMIGLADQFRLTVYDAAYLELAVRKHTDLLTFDNDLSEAAQNAGLTVLGRT